MTKEDYEKYRQNGGSYVIPVEMFDDLLNEEYQLLNLYKQKQIKYLEEEISRLNSRWKEFAVRINRPKDVLPRIEAKISAYKDILERLNSSKYDN